MIRYKNYKITPSGGRFDLVKEKTIPEYKNSEGKVIPEHFTDEQMGFSMQFESCLHSIAIDLLEQNQSLETIYDYIKAYKSEREQMTNTLTT